MFPILQDVAVGGQLSYSLKVTPGCFLERSTQTQDDTLSVVMSWRGTPSQFLVTPPLEKTVGDKQKVCNLVPKL